MNRVAGFAPVAEIPVEQVAAEQASRWQVVRIQRVAPGSPVEAGYDAAGESSEFAEHWAQVDRLDADSANSKFVRDTLVARSRHETKNNGYVKGIISTHRTNLIGKGPTLKMQTPSEAFNQMVQSRWKQWCKAVQFRRKLTCMAGARVQDGSGFGVAVHNPKIANPVKLDLKLIETEQVTTPLLPFGTPHYVDGVKLDAFDNVEHFDILPAHPGDASQMAFGNPLQPIPVAPEFVFHWFTLERPGQHRAVPELSSTLQVGVGSRRFREATVAAAETAAEHAALIHTDLPPNGEAASTDKLLQIPIDKRMGLLIPEGWEPTQMKAEHPNATYREFTQSQVAEMGRPLDMSYPIAASDYSNSTYASGRLDRLPYNLRLDLERLDCEDLVLDPMFDLWFAEASIVYGWFGGAKPEGTPLHGWDWPKHPVIDRLSESDANDKDMRNGSKNPVEIAAADGVDAEERLAEMAKYFGKSVEEMRNIQCTALFNSQNQQASQQQADNQAQQQGAANDAQT